MIRKSIAALVISALALSAGCSGGGEKKTSDQASGPGSFDADVRTAAVTYARPEKELTLTGKVLSDPDKTVSYSSLVSGVIERTHFSLGDRVIQGQNLLEIRSADLSALQSGEVALRSELKVAQRELQTARSLSNDNLISERELFEAQGRVEQAQAELDKLSADMAVFGTNQGGGTFSLKSPASGYIISKNVSPGGTVSADGDPLFTIADLGTVWVVANVYASNLQFVREGMEAAITTVSYPGEVFTGRIDAVSQVFDPEDKALKARIVLSNDKLKLKPEMSVVVCLKETFDEDLACLPSDAVIFDDDRYYVVIRQAAGGFSLREVVPFCELNGTVYIASGLAAGEDAVLKDQLLIFAELKGI